MENGFKLIRTISNPRKKGNTFEAEVGISPEYLIMLSDYLLDVRNPSLINDVSPLSRRWFEVFKFFIEQGIGKLKDDKFSTSYKTFCKWMPIDEKQAIDDIEAQLKEIQMPFVEMGLIKEFSLKSKETSKKVDWIANYKLGFPSSWNDQVSRYVG